MSPTASVAPASRAPQVLTFELPAALRAAAPPEARGLRRDGVRLMISQGEAWPVSGRFRDLASYLRPGDLLVVNTSATLPALLLARRPDGRRAEVRLATPLASDGLWAVELHAAPAPGDGPRPGETWLLPGPGYVHLLGPYRGSPRLWVADLHLPVALPAYLAQHARASRPAGVEADWVLAQPGVTAAIAGARGPAQVEGWLAAGDLALDPADLEELDRAVPVPAASDVRGAAL